MKSVSWADMEDEEPPPPAYVPPNLRPKKGELPRPPPRAPTVKKPKPLPKST